MIYLEGFATQPLAPDLAEPSRVAQIKFDYDKRRDRLRRNRRVNPLSARSAETVDDVYGIDGAEGGCVICHKWAPRSRSSRLRRRPR